MKWILSILLMGSFYVHAQSKEEVSNMLDQMEKMGTFTPEQIKAAKAKLNNLSDDDLNKIKAKAGSAAQDPKMREEASKIIEQMKTSKNQ